MHNTNSFLDTRPSPHSPHSTPLGSYWLSSHSLSVTPSLFRSSLKTYLFHKSFHPLVISPSPPDSLHRFWRIIQRLDLITCRRLSWVIVNFGLNAAHLYFFISTTESGRMVKAFGLTTLRALKHNSSYTLLGSGVVSGAKEDWLRSGAVIRFDVCEQNVVKFDALVYTIVNCWRRTN